MDGAFFADFQYGEMGAVVRASFAKPIVTRLAQYYSIGAMEDGAHQGIESEHFAYVLDESPFMEFHRSGLAEHDASAKHYRFLTPDVCLDVISTADPYIRSMSAVYAGGKT
jgi:hypothetical protein